MKFLIDFIKSIIEFELKIHSVKKHFKVTDKDRLKAKEQFERFER